MLQERRNKNADQNHSVGARAGCNDCVANSFGQLDGMEIEYAPGQLHQEFLFTKGGEVRERVLLTDVYTETVVSLKPN